MARTALITGIAGQDGSYLAELLLGKGYEVHGMVRGSPSEAYPRLAHLSGKVTLHSGDLLDRGSLDEVMRACTPDEIYNLAGMSFVAASWPQPVLAAESNAVGVVRLLEAMREVVPEARFYQASSSEMFGIPREVPQTEVTPFGPTSPYGAAKCYGHFLTVAYRESYGLFACAGILYNHESERRGVDLVTRKVSRGAAAIKLGLEAELLLGDLEAQRDWGHARDYVEAMWLMLQQEQPEDYVIATGESHSIKQLVRVAFDHVGLDPEPYIRIDSRFRRPADVGLLVGDASKAREHLGWAPRTTFEDLVRQMVDADLELLAAVQKV